MSSDIYLLYSVIYLGTEIDADTSARRIVNVTFRNTPWVKKTPKRNLWW